MSEVSRDRWPTPQLRPFALVVVLDGQQHIAEGAVSRRLRGRPELDGAPFAARWARYRFTSLRESNLCVEAALRPRRSPETALLEPPSATRGSRGDGGVPELEEESRDRVRATRVFLPFDPERLLL